MDTFITEQNVFFLPALDRHEKLKARIRARNELLHEGVQAGVDIDQLADELKLSPEWRKILKALTGPRKKVNFQATAKRLRVRVSTVRWIARIIGVKSHSAINNPRYNKSREKQKIIKSALNENQGKSDRQITAILAEQHQIEVERGWIGAIRRRLRNVQEKKATVKRMQRPPLTVAERKAVLSYIAKGKPSSASIIIKELGLTDASSGSLTIIYRIYDDYWLPTPRNKTRAMDVDLFLDAAEELVRKELACSRTIIKPVVESYLNMLPYASFKALALKYTNAPFDDQHMEFAARHLAKLSDAQVQAIADIGRKNWENVEIVNPDAAYLKNLPPADRETVITRRLNTLSVPEIEPIAQEYLDKFSQHEIGTMLTKRFDARSAHACMGMMQRTEGIRSWPTNRLFLDAATTFYLCKAGITDPKQLEELTEGHRTHLEVSAGAMLALQFAWAVRGVYFNRINVRRRSAKGIENAPNRQMLEKMAAGFRKNQKSPGISRLASAALA